MPIDPKYYLVKAIEYFNHGDLTSAMELSKNAIEYDPENEQCLNLLGVLYRQQNNVARSKHCFNQAISVNDKNPNYHYNLGVVQRESGDVKGALLSQNKALKLSSENTVYLNEIGLIYIDLGKLKKARIILEEALEIDSLNISTCINLSHLYELIGDLHHSIEFSNKATEINPDRPEPYNNAGKALIAANFHEQGINYIKQACINGCKHPSKIHQSILMNMLYPDCYCISEIVSEHEKWANTYLDKNISREKLVSINQNKRRKLKIGFVSADFVRHSISYFLIPIFEKINHSKFDIYCYSNSRVVDEITKKYKNLSDYWRVIIDKSESTNVKMIQEDEIDILIDLSGHSLGSSIGIFSFKPAPIQISYLGYPFTTGLKNIDYRITDNYADPEYKSEDQYTEKLCRISSSFLCYKPDREININRFPPLVKNDYVTFGSFNKFAKLSGSLIKIWSEILLAVENSRILLKNSRPIPDMLRDNLLTSFEKCGVDSSRVILHHAISDKYEHMSFYNNIDICLDSFPYNGTTTTFEAIYMGVPVIVLVGESHHARVGYSILSNLALPNLIADCPQHYVSIAKKLAVDVPRLKEYRCILRERLMSSSLADTTQFTLKFEGILREVWIKYCDEN